MESLNKITEKIIGCCIEVHRNLGPGLLESIYEKALCHESYINKIKFVNQLIIPIIYKETKLGEHRIDLLVEDEINCGIKGC